MKKSVITVGIICAALLLLILLIFRNNNPFGKENSSFATDTETKITRIEFSDEKGEITLEKTGENWLIDGSETRKSGIQFILRILQEIQIKSPVSAELFDAEVTQKGIRPVKVKVFSGRKQIRSFLVYKTASNSYGNIMKMKEGSKPFIVYVPGFDTEIGSAFTLNKLFWIPYNLFNYMPSEISSVSLENIEDTASSFRIVREGNSFRISDAVKWDSTLINRYLSYFTRVPFDSWALEMSNEEKRETEIRKPLYRIFLATNGGKKSTLTLWQRTIAEGDSVYADTDRLLGKTDSSDEFVIIRYFDIDPLLKRKSYFFRE
jgi:hypothetical protein